MIPSPGPNATRSHTQPQPAARTTTRSASRSSPSSRTGAVPRVSVRNDIGLVSGAFGAFALVVASLLILVSVRTAQIRAGYRVHDLESEVMKLKQDRAALDVERATLLRPARLAELSRTTLGLVPVDASHLAGPERAPAVPQ